MATDTGQGRATGGRRRQTPPTTQPPGGQQGEDRFGYGESLGPPPVSGAAGGFIGVPKGYIAQVPRRLTPNYQNPAFLQYMPLRPGAANEPSTGTRRDINPATGKPGPPIPIGTPRYAEGDQYKPRNQSPDKIWEQQQLLVKLGLLKGRFLKRVWDEPTAAAWAQVLAYANQTGITEQQALLMMSRGGAVTGEAGGGVMEVDENGNIVPAFDNQTLAPPIEQTDPRVLREVFRKAAIDISGRGWSEDQINKAAMAYNALERERQEQMYHAQQFGGTFTSTPSPEQFIDTYVRDIQPQQTQLHEGIQWAEEAMSLLAAPAWGVSAGGGSQ